MKPAAKRRRASVPATSHARQPLTPDTELINRLREIVKRDGVTKTAERLELDRVHVHKLLNGERAPGWPTLAALYRHYPSDFLYLRKVLYPEHLG